MSLVNLAKAINSFGPSETVPFTAYAGTRLPTNVQDTDQAYVTIRETDRDDIGRSSDTTDALYESYFDVYISAADHAKVQAVEDAILARQSTTLEGVWWLFQDSETIDQGTKGRPETILELRVFWAKTYTRP